MEEKLFPEEEAAPAAKDGKQSRKHGKHRKLKIVLGIIAGAVAALLIVTNVLAMMDRANGTAVEAAAVKKGDITSTLTANGTLASTNTKAYYSPVTASINECNVKEGMFVAAGTKVIGFDTSALEQDNQKAQLTKDASLNGFQDTLNKSDEAASKKADADSQAASCQSQIDADSQQINSLTQAISSRTSLLSSGSALSDPSQDPQIAAWQNQLSTLQSEVSTLQAKKSEAEATSSSMESIILSGAARAQISDNSSLASLEASAAQSQLDKASAGIVTEFDGVITQMNVSNGTAVAQGTALFSISSLNEACVEVSLTKANFADVKEGQTAEIIFNDHTYQGTVTEVGRAASSGTQSAQSLLNSAQTTSSTASSSSSNILATVKITNPDQNLCLGLDAKVVIKTDSRTNTLTVPRKAVSLSADGTFCYIVENGVVVRKTVATGISSDDETEITSGLSEGDQVITTLPDSVSEGSKVYVSSDVSQ